METNTKNWQDALRVYLKKVKYNTAVKKLQSKRLGFLRKLFLRDPAAGVSELALYGWFISLFQEMETVRESVPSDGKRFARTQVLAWPSGYSTPIIRLSGMDGYSSRFTVTKTFKSDGACVDVNKEENSVLDGIGYWAFPAKEQFVEILDEIQNIIYNAKL